MEIPEELTGDPEIMSFVVTAASVLTKEQRVAFAKYLCLGTNSSVVSMWGGVVNPTLQSLKAEIAAEKSFKSLKAFGKLYGDVGYIEPEWSPIYEQASHNWKPLTDKYFGQGWGALKYAEALAEGLTDKWKPKGKYVYKGDPSNAHFAYHAYAGGLKWLFEINHQGKLYEFGNKYPAYIFIGQKDLVSFVNKSHEIFPKFFPPTH